MRVLFASTRGAGHFNPLIPFVTASLSEGDEVLVVAPEDLRATVESANFPFRPLATPPEEELGPTWGRVQSGASAEEAEAIVVGEIFGRLNTRAALPGMRALGEEWKPDLVVREPAEFSSAIVARELGVPQVRVAIGLASTERQLTQVGTAGLEEHGDVAAEAIAASPYFTFFPRSLEDPGDEGPPQTRRLRESAAPREPRPLGEWWPGQDGPLVYLSFGSVAGTLPTAVPIYRSAMEAVAEVPARVLVTIGNKLSPDEVRPIPDNVHVAGWVPQADVLEEADLVVCHGGSGTVLGALAAGLPLVVVPLFADQPPNARRVEQVGAGVVVEPLRDSPSAAIPSSIDPIALRGAVTNSLGDPTLGARAGELAAEMQALPSLDGALRSLVRDEGT